MNDQLPPSLLPEHLSQTKKSGIGGKLVLIAIILFLVLMIMVTRHFYKENQRKMNEKLAEVKGVENVDIPEPNPAPEDKPDAKPELDLSVPGDDDLRKRAIKQILDARAKRNNDFIKKPASEEKSIDKVYLSAIEKIRDDYVSQLKKASTKTFDTQLEKRLLAQAERASDLDTWIKLLAPDEKRVIRKSALEFVGNWDAHSQGKITRRIAHADGRMEIVGRDWKVTWQILSDDTLEVEWGKGKPSVFKRDGDGWKGKSPFGIPMQLKRGDW